MKNLNQKGFTLIELIIIMVILGVLAAVAVPRLGNTINSSEISSEESILGSLRSAVEVYAVDQVVNNSTKSYPMNPFDALDNKSKNDLFGKGWGYDDMNSKVYHQRNDGNYLDWSYNNSTGEIN